MSPASADSDSSEFTKGIAILLAAQFLAAYMGAYVEDQFTIYGANWTENLFYGHFLCLPWFLPLSGVLRNHYAKLAATPPLGMSSILQQKQDFLGSTSDSTLALLRPVIERTPQGVLFLLINSITQLACISGVNLLSSKSSAVTVTIVLNIRKLVSFIFSTILFGHHLSNKMMIGSALVFGSGALYGWETSWRLPQERKAKEQANGTLRRKSE